MRTVECTRYHYPGGKKQELEKVIGEFHQWGCEYEEFDTGAGNYSVAIVELPDGTVETFMPSHIKFLK